MIKLDEDTFCKIIHADVIEGIRALPDDSIDCIVYSPPYWKHRRYTESDDREIGQENDPRDYINKMVEVVEEFRPKLKESGTLFINIGDNYFGRGYGGGPSSRERKGGKKWNDKSPKYTTNPYRDTVHLPYLKTKNLLLIPSRVAIAIQDTGNWILRNDIIWQKKSCQPFSGKDRLQNKYEHVFFFTKNKKYYFDLDSVRIPRAESSIKRAFATTHPKKHKGYKKTQHAISPKGLVKATAKTKAQYQQQFLTDTYDGSMITKEDIEKACNTLGLDTSDSCLICGKPFVKHLGKFCKVKGVNPGDIILAGNHGFKGAHFAVFDPELITPLIKMGCPKGGVVLDPFCGVATTLLTARMLGRNAVGIEFNIDSVQMGKERLINEGILCNVYEV